MTRFAEVMVILMLVTLSWLLPPAITLGSGAGALVLPLHGLAKFTTFSAWVFLSVLKGDERAKLVA